MINMVNIKKRFYACFAFLILLSGCSSNQAPLNISITDGILTPTAVASGAAQSSNPVQTPSDSENAAVTENITEAAPAGDENIDQIIADMTLKEKIGQLFFVAFRQDENGNDVTEINDEIIKVIDNIGIGGVILYGENIVTADQTSRFVSDMQSLSKTPLFIGVDEEGGRVTRTQNLNVPRIGSAREIGGPENAYATARTIAGYLSPLGINVDFAPVADVLTNPDNTVIGDRAFSSDAETAAGMASTFALGLQDNGVCACAKHFPGHGDTAGDSHTGAAETLKTFQELNETEFEPFRACIGAGVDFIMAGHIDAPNVTGNNEPASLSRIMLTDLLRDTLGFNKIIITDALEMKAVTDYYDSGEAAVKAIEAGADMLLMPADLETAYNAVINAVNSGEIAENRIDKSVKRILAVKIERGIIV